MDAKPDWIDRMAADLKAAQAEVERLQAEVQRLKAETYDANKARDLAVEWRDHDKDRLTTAHNDALEAACSAVLDGFKVWAAKPHNKKWVKRIDGTPIPNDVPVCIQTAIVALKRPVTEGDKA